MCFMRIAVISDIHGRHEGLQAALIRLAEVDLIINLGDVAGFGAQDNDCYYLLKEKRIVNIIGNHEYEALGEDVVSSDEDGSTLREDNKSFIRSFKPLSRIKLDRLHY